MVVCIKPQQRKKEESEILRGERDQIKFIDRAMDVKMDASVRGIVHARKEGEMSKKTTILN